MKGMEVTHRFSFKCLIRIFQAVYDSHLVIAGILGEVLDYCCEPLDAHVLQIM